MENESLVRASVGSLVSKPRHEPPGEHGRLLKQLVDAQKPRIGRAQVLQYVVAVCARLLDHGFDVKLRVHPHQRSLLVELQLEILPNPVLKGDADAKFVTQRLFVDAVVLVDELLVKAEDPVILHTLYKVLQLVDAAAPFDHVVGERYPVVQLGDHLAAGALENAHDGVCLLYRCVLDVGDLHVLVLGNHDLVSIVVKL